jgi:hypothetical protein
MTEQRRMEIALLVVEQMAIERGIPGADTLKRDVGNQAQKLGLSTQEVMAFYKSFVPKIYARIFGYDSVTISASVQ